MPNVVCCSSVNVYLLKPVVFSKMPLHKYPPCLWEALKLKKGIYARLPQHYLKSYQDTSPPTPVHWKPLGVKYRVNPKTGHKERVQDVPIPIYYPPESQDGLWGGEGWICGYRYSNNDKVSSWMRLNSRTVRLSDSGMGGFLPEPGNKI